MIKHSQYKLESRTENLGRFDVPGVHGSFEVRKLTGRKERPVLMVVRAGWEKAPAFEDVTPVIEVFFEKNGQTKPVNQASHWRDLGKADFDFAAKAIEVFEQKNKVVFVKCHRT